MSKITIQKRKSLERYRTLTQKDYSTYEEANGLSYFYVKPPEIQTVWLIDKPNNTSRYLDDIFTIDNPAFAEHIPDIYPKELQLIKQILPTKKHLSWI